MQCKAIETIMKTATLPSLRVEPELRHAAEGVLNKGETLSGFIEESLRSNIERRLNQNEFIARGLASRDRAKNTGHYFSAETVLEEIGSRLSNAKKKRRP